MLKRKEKIMILMLMCAGFLGSLSQSLLTSALPSIMSAFGVSAALGQWVTTGYILVMGIITAISALLFYRFHTRPLLEVSLGIFIAGAVVAYFAPNFPALLTGRILQACGAGPLIPLLQTVVLYVYPKEKQGQAIGLTGIIVGFAPAVGPTLSGILVDAFGWRSIFVFLMIITAVVLVIAHFTVTEVGDRSRSSFDGISLMLYGVGFSAFMAGVTFMKGGNLLQLKILILLVLGVACLALFARRQLCIDQPILKLSLMKYRTLDLGIFILGTAYALNMAGTILVPLFNQTLCGWSATLSGLIMMPGSLLIAILSPLSGRLMDRFGAKRNCLFGMVCMIIGNLTFALFPTTCPIALVVISYAIRCTGMAFLMTPSTALAVQELPLVEKPHGMAILNSFRQMSGSLFSTIFVVIATIVSGAESLALNGMHVAFYTMTALAIAGTFIAMMIPDHVSSK